MTHIRLSTTAAGDGRPPLRASRASAILLAAAFSFGATQGTAQQSNDVPAVFEALAGDWVGSGVLLGSRAAFHMTWTPLDGGFVRLSFANMWVQEAGDTVPVLTSEATYRVDGATALGVWLDDRPQQLTLSAVLTDTSVVTAWTAPAENGRTEYVVLSPDEVSVRDFVIVDGAPQLFAEGSYARAPASGR